MPNKSNRNGTGPRLRKPVPRQNATQITVCGRKIRGGFICGLPPNHFPKDVHATLALDGDSGEVLALLRFSDSPDEIPEVWALTAPEANPS